MKKANLFFVGFLTIITILMLESATCEDPDPEPTPVPELSTTPVTDIMANMATGGGTVISDGGSTVTERGVCWATYSGPTLNDSHTMDGNGTGVFTSEITGLDANTTYSVRAYATNSSGVGYGNVETFTTTGSGGLPVVTTSSVSDITNESAVCGGNVTSDGGAEWVMGGVCWNISPNPVKTDNSTIDINNEGSFISNINYLEAVLK